MDNMILLLAIDVVTGVVFFLLGWIVGRRLMKAKLIAARQEADRIIADAQKEAETIFKEKMLELKDEQLQLRSNLEAELRQKQDDLARGERSLKDRERNLNVRTEDLDKKNKEAERLIQSNTAKEKALQQKQSRIDTLEAEGQAALERVAGLSKEQALEELKESLLEKAREATAEMVKEMRDRARINANKEAKEVVVSAIQRSAVDHAVESTVSVVPIPNDEIKGRIIGREGRNIRAFEQATGVDIIVDDTPEAVIISAFDPLRREVARMALERLMADGRIHPGRIEELVKKCEKEMQEQLVQIGEAACHEAGISGLHAEIIKLLGRLKFRTSYGQNILQHSIEVAHLTGLMCAQCGLDAKLGRRAGLLHDLGKSIDRFTEGTHVQIGVELAKKYREPKVVINAIAAHHGDEEYTSPISVLAQAADAISGARPGARRETLEIYIQRLQKLEEITNDFRGVQRAFAIQAGREVRVIVEPEKVTDAMAEVMAMDIAKKIESELEYPGQIKVTVLREFRATGLAK
ncbi:ribonuclease Y [candidate division KSB1 bacterium]|nr:MAG: ribonuclease Y [candidate division KSB1 bacterium]